jgi:hypothetical protein
MKSRLFFLLIILSILGITAIACSSFTQPIGSPTAVPTNAATAPTAVPTSGIQAPTITPLPTQPAAFPTEVSAGSCDGALQGNTDLAVLKYSAMAIPTDAHAVLLRSDDPKSITFVVPVQGDEYKQSLPQKYWKGPDTGIYMILVNSGCLKVWDQIFGTKTVLLGVGLHNLQKVQRDPYPTENLDMESCDGFKACWGGHAIAVEWIAGTGVYIVPQSAPATPVPMNQPTATPMPTYVPTKAASLGTCKLGVELRRNDKEPWGFVLNVAANDPKWDRNSGIPKQYTQVADSGIYFMVVNPGCKAVFGDEIGAASYSHILTINNPGKEPIAKSLETLARDPLPYPWDQTPAVGSCEAPLQHCAAGHVLWIEVSDATN